MRPKLAFCIAVGMFIVILAFYAFCQPTKDHLSQHLDRDEWEDSIGLKFVNVTAKEGDTVYFYQTRKYEQRLASMVWDKHSRLFDPTNRNFTGCYVVFYCKKHLVIYLMQRSPCTDEPNILSAKQP